MFLKSFIWKLSKPKIWKPKKFLGSNKNWTPIQQKSVEIQIGSNPIHIITKVQFSIQWTMGHTIHQAQRLTLEHLIFDPSNVTKHGLTYIPLFCIYSKEHLYLLCPLLSNFFYADAIVEEEMFHWKTT